MKRSISGLIVTAAIAAAFPGSSSAAADVSQRSDALLRPTFPALPTQGLPLAFVVCGISEWCGACLPGSHLRSPHLR